MASEAGIFPQLLSAAVGCSADRADTYAPLIAETCDRFAINTPARIAAFLAQIGHESGAFRYTSEVWGPTPAQERYEGRADLGNTQPGDGSRFRGHGLIQTTGRYNHAKTRDALASLGCPDFEANPDALAEPRWAALSAGWYWQSHGCNELADAGAFEAITRKINGGLNGQEDRLRRWEKAKAALITGESKPAAAPPQAPRQKTTTEGEPMLPLIPLLGAILPSIAQSVPALAKLFGPQSEVSERNVKAATLAVDIVQQAVGAANAQEAAEKISSDPEAAKVAQTAIESRWHDLTEAGGGGIEGARKAEAAFIASGSKPWESPSFWALLLLLPLVYMVAGSVAGLWGYDGWPSDVRTAIATALVSLIIGGATGYYWGSTTSRNRTTPPAE
jgi:putative chitinase